MELFKVPFNKIAESAARSAARSARSAYYSFQRDLLFKCIKELFESPSSVKSHGYKLKVIE